MNLPNPEPGENSGVIVELRNVSKHYFGPLGGFLGSALIAVSIEVRRGEIFALIGPSGSGKSSVAKIIGGQMKPMEGKVKVFGRSPRHRSIKPRIAYLPQPGSNPSNALRDLALLQALTKRAELLILDEPLSGLDSVAQQEMKGFILDQARQGKTILLTSQLLLDVADMCNRIALFYKGRVEAVGTLDELLSSPEVLRSMAPVLSSSLSEQMLQILRNDLSERTSKQPPLARASSKITSTENEMLSPLIKPAAAETPQVKSPSSADPIDHQRLAQLTRPHPGDSSALSS